MTRRRTMLIPFLVLTAVLLGGGVVSAVHCVAGTICYGTAGPDTLKGTKAENSIVGLGGADEIYGYESNDDLHGDAQTDTSRDGNDRLYGGLGNDFLNGYGGDDLLVGGEGHDVFDARELSSLNPGVDTIKGGDGGDVIQAEDGRKDFIDCGRGEDEVYFDKDKDVITNCEIKHPRV